ncbi:MAG: prepilin-type N-terminal cleavage/methylation domain-containing protein [Desulfobacterales bacterium]|nr:prepilin-type N-terminal cleavage/methylation domain-containing protein [Desulfobacterales bacterium]
MNIKKISDNKGFTIIEFMIAISIIAISILGISTMQISSVRNNKAGNEQTIATKLAQDQMEVLKAENVNDSDSLLNPSSFPATVFDSNNPINENGGSGGSFTRYWEVDEYRTDESRLVTVTVEWTRHGFGGETRNVTLTSLTRGSGF